MVNIILQFFFQTILKQLTDMGFKETRAKKALILNRLVDLGHAATNQYHKYQQMSHTIFLKIVVKKSGMRLVCKNIWATCHIFAKINT